MITEQQSEMIDYIIAGNNKSDTAKLLGVSRQTVYEWLKLKEVQKEKQKRLNEIKKEAKNKIATKVDKIGSTQREKYKKQITDNIDLAIGDELVLFSAKTKLGKKEIQAKIESEVYKDNTL